MLHVISLAQYAAVYTRSWAVDSLNGRVRLQAENDRLLQEVALLREEIRIKDARMASIAAQRRLPPALLTLNAKRNKPQPLQNVDSRGTVYRTAK